MTQAVFVFMYPAGKHRATSLRRTLVRGIVDWALPAVQIAGGVETFKNGNLSLDCPNDKKADFVGSYWVDTSKTERALLFFIAEKNANGKYAFGYSEFRMVKQEDVMSKEIKDVDEGVYHELLLDAFDYDNDGVSEIFTYIQSFEGAGFNAYRRENSSWKRTFEGANYHCGY